jgi:phosphoribosylglycinamide formyltransferase-1
VNVHPSLLPAHAGLMDLAVHASVLAAGDGESGCTVHLVDEVVDTGAITRGARCHSALPIPAPAAGSLHLSIYG